MSRLSGKIVSVANLDDGMIGRMFCLMDDVYQNVDIKRFHSDLKEKDHVILMFDGDGLLQGFSTLKVYRDEYAGKMRSLLYSGDTVIHPSHWGSFALPRLWGAYAFALMKYEASRECYWFLMSKGYKTYRFLPVFFEVYFPSDVHQSNKVLSEVRNAFAKCKFGKNFDSDTGVISFGGRRDFLKQGIADIDSTRVLDPHVYRFIQLNPGWSQGDELACIAPLVESNFKELGRKMAKKELARQSIIFE